MSKLCVFSSLRQDLVRRLINTDYQEGVDYRIDIINTFIQLMVNSNHSFQYIKSVVLQGISKYLYMYQRSNLDQNNKRFCPLHRSRSYKNDMRKLIKYTDHARWYTTEKVGDLFKDCWKRWIKRKGFNNKRNKKLGKNGGMAPDTTTVMFVPKTLNGELLQRIQKVEDNLSHMDWRTKLVEKPGIPLFTKFSKRFNMLQGCARGSSCYVCDGKGTKCCVKGVVYKAKCQGCQDDNTGIYIGETSRQFGTRVSEHISNVCNWKKNSFIIDHWMQQHGSDPEPPVFKFEVISKHNDALSRQLGEALQIRKQGNLNRKQEFSINELIRVQSSKYTWDEDQENKKRLEEERDRDLKLLNFINVMSAVRSNKRSKTGTDNLTANTYSFQIKKREGTSQQSQQGPAVKRVRTMEASTPLQHREPKLHNMSPSPIQGIKPLSESCSMEVSDENSSYDQNGGDGKATGISGDTEGLVVTPPKQDDPLLSVAKKSIAMNEHDSSKNSYMERQNTERMVVKNYIKTPTILDDAVDLLAITWEGDCKFKACDSDTNSLEISEILAGEGTPLVAVENAPTEDVNIIPCGTESHTENVDLSAPAQDEKFEPCAAESHTEPATGSRSDQQVCDAFGESHSDDLIVKEIIESRTRNKLYGTFARTPQRIKTEAGRIISGLLTPTKRKLSPDTQLDTPSPKQHRTEKNSFSTISDGFGVKSQQGERKTPSRSRQRNKGAVRGKDQKLGKGQVLITHMLKDANKSPNVEERQ